jgi:hypothetical protein
MGKMNIGRVVLGGIVAGVIINLVEGIVNGIVLQPQWAQAARALGQSGEMTAGQIVGFNLWGFAAGILAVWLYAAIRPRYGEGPKTAMYAGLAIWALTYVMPNALMSLLRIYPNSLLFTGTVVGLAEVLAASLAGAYLYKESAAPAGAAMRA